MPIFPKPDFFDIENTLTVEEVIELLESLKCTIKYPKHENIFNKRIDEVIKKLNQNNNEGSN